MLNRRILRVKAFKTIYSLAENSGMTLNEAQASLTASCEATRELYLYLLAIIDPLTKLAGERIALAKTKIRQTEEEKNPNLKFVENAISSLLAEDPDFTKLISKKKLSWEYYDAFLLELYNTVKGRKYFLDYMSSPERSLKADANLWVKIFEREFEDNPALEPILDDQSIYWTDDLGYALGWVIRTLRSLGEGECWNLPPLYASELPGNSGMANDKDFVESILRHAYNKYDEFVSRAASLTTKWTRERICATDMALLVCGMAEAEAFPSTPVRIIINEYVEISKFYSTPESRSFVNGLLDKLINSDIQ